VTGPRILLVEDDDLNQALVRALLARSGDPRLQAARVISAGTLARARALLAEDAFDVVLLDMTLPDGSGLELAGELHAQGAGAPAVIAVTGAVATHQEAALAAGCAAILGKPYRQADLCEAIAAHLQPGQPGAADGAAAAAHPPGRREAGMSDSQDLVQALDEARQAQHAAEQAKDEFVARIGHELRTPVSTILGFAELLNLADLSAEHREWAAMMLKAARHLASFMDDITAISHAQARILSLSIEAVPADKVIADALDLIRPLAATHGVNLDPPPQTGEHVLADEPRLRQVLLNLLSNAVKYNHPAGRITITTSHATEGQLRVIVTDTGRGIAACDIGQLFRPFQRLDAAQAGVEGAGLGLTLSRQLIEAMGGTIGATSTVGEGSVFWVDLPLTLPAPTSATVPRTETIGTSRAYTSPKTVLYIEDMVETLRLIEQILRQRPSVRIVPAMLGGVALDLAAEHHPDLILLDLNLPDIPGEELLRRLKSDRATSATPVVVISADASPLRIDRLLAAGAASYLTKPIGVRDFLHTIDTVLTRPPEEAAAPGQAGVTARQPGPEGQGQEWPGESCR
jgi:signal transduction histidine kinase